MNNSVKINEPSGMTDRREDSIFAPTSRELERLLFAIESSLQINRRFQFFLWAQGVLQSFLPHQTLLCVSGNLQSGAYTIDAFESDAVSQNSSTEVDEPTRAVVALAIERWQASNTSPISLGIDDEWEGTDTLREAISESGLGNLLAYGTKEFKAQGTFLIFGRLERKAGRRSMNLLELMLPILHFALHRYRANELSDNAKATGNLPVLSEREIQIVRSVCEGKTNFEIGADLDISPLTVKNHIQRILRKLGVNNRAQAVASCIELGLF